MKNIFENFLDELQARHLIEDCLLRFARAIDRKDWSEALLSYHEDAFDNHGFFKGPPDKFIEILKKIHENQDHSMHLCTNILIDFKSKTSALVESYIIAIQRFLPDSENIYGVRNVGVARYLDHFELRDGHWRVSKRVLVLGDLIKTPVSTPLQFPPGFEIQQHGKNDILYELLQTTV